MSLMNANLPGFFKESDLDLQGLQTCCAQQTHLEDYPNALAVEKKVVIYDGRHLNRCCSHEETTRDIVTELHMCLSEGPGVFVMRNAYARVSLLDDITAVFYEIIETERKAAGGGGDHFGQNERIWNALQKVCVRAPELFIPYFGNPLIALAARAWLGPAYQITAQVNNVKPGSPSQTPHRDYHLGFQHSSVIAAYPARMQCMSQYLTLQGAIAHTDMSLASGPTLLLPYSQRFPAGYMAFDRPEFVAFFEAHAVQLPLSKGDMLFFSPALYHGAGHNNMERDRMANLLQISSPFGRPMETVNRMAMLEAVYPHLLDQRAALTPTALRDVIAAVTEGYAFPTNLDTDPPLGGNAPRTAADLVTEALAENQRWDQLKNTLMAWSQRRQA